MKISQPNCQHLNSHSFRTIFHIQCKIKMTLLCIPDTCKNELINFQVILTHFLETKYSQILIGVEMDRRRQGIHLLDILEWKVPCLQKYFGAFQLHEMIIYLFPEENRSKTYRCRVVFFFQMDKKQTNRCCIFFIQGSRTNKVVDKQSINRKVEFLYDR